MDFEEEPTGNAGTACNNAVGKLISFFYFAGLYDYRSRESCTSALCNNFAVSLKASEEWQPDTFKKKTKS